MKSFATLLGLSLLLSGASATHGLDMSTLVKDWACLKNAGYTFAIPRSWYSYGALDMNAKANIANARAAGIANVDVYMFPCRGKSAQ